MTQEYLQPEAKRFVDTLRDIDHRSPTDDLRLVTQDGDKTTFSAAELAPLFDTVPEVEGQTYFAQTRTVYGKPEDSVFVILSSLKGEFSSVSSLRMNIDSTGVLRSITRDAETTYDDGRHIIGSSTSYYPGQEDWYTSVTDANQLLASMQSAAERFSQSSE